MITGKEIFLRAANVFVQLRWPQPAVWCLKHALRQARFAGDNYAVGHILTAIRYAKAID